MFHAHHPLDEKEGGNRVLAVLFVPPGRIFSESHFTPVSARIQDVKMNKKEKDSEMNPYGRHSHYCQLGY